MKLEVKVEVVVMEVMEVVAMMVVVVVARLGKEKTEESKVGTMQSPKPRG